MTANGDMIKVEYLEKIPAWWKERRYYDLVLSNDIDSFMACEVLKQVKGWEINYFYTFNAMGLTDSVASDEYIGVDISFDQDIKCFDNHVVLLHQSDSFNSQSINFNVADKISRANYFNKYCGSTLLMVWALYDLPLPESEEGKMILLAIDSTYKGYYSPFSRDNEANKYYLCEVMGFHELYEVLKRHKLKDFQELNKKYKLAEKIILEDGFLKTNIDLEGLRKVFDLPFLLPKKRFHLMQEFENKGVFLGDDLSISKDEICQDIFSIALTKKNYMNYSVRK